MKYIAYYRVSTKMQANSGLGLEAQRTTVLSYIKNNGNEIVAEFTEQESGKKDKRPELLKAISEAREHKATLVIAKLDRLSRNVKFIAELMDSKVKFVCCDMPDATELTIHIFAAMADWEHKRISSRTKEALQVLKDKGVKLGTPKNLTDESRRLARESISRSAREDQSVRFAYHFMTPRREKGMSYQKIADELNAEGYRTRQGKQFHAQSVHNIWKRFDSDRLQTKTQPLIRSMIIMPKCYDRNCKHFIGIKSDKGELNERPYCPAYPDGIPDSIADGDDLHLEVRSDQDNKIVFEKDINQNSK